MTNIYPGDYVKFKTVGGMEAYGDVAHVFPDGEITVIPDGGRQPIVIGQILNVEKQGSLGARQHQQSN